ncbi:hypothetical protein FHR85_001461 [Alkalibacillus almallahensis]|nr:hypothetical protein [Alkalibacillus almallahensis]
MWNKIFFFSTYGLFVPIIIFTELSMFEYYTPDSKRITIIFFIYFYLSAPIFIVGEKLNVFSPGPSKHRIIINSLLLVWVVGLIVFAYFIMPNVVEFDL